MCCAPARCRHTFKNGQRVMGTLTNKLLFLQSYCGNPMIARYGRRYSRSGRSGDAPVVADVLLSADKRFTALSAADQAAHIAALLPALSVGTVQSVASRHLASKKSSITCCMCAQQPLFQYDTILSSRTPVMRCANKSAAVGPMIVRCNTQHCGPQQHCRLQKKSTLPWRVHHSLGSRAGGPTTFVICR